MHFDIITIFPELFSDKNSYLNKSILKRAQEKKLIKIQAHNLRDFTTDKHRKVDDRPFGGGPGMVMQIQPIIKAIESIKSNERPKVILFTPGGKQFDNKIAAKLTKKEQKNNQLILICGRYEGIDARLKKVIKDSGFKIQEISIGPYVLTGGELPAMVLIDSVARQIPGVLGKTESLEEKRYGPGLSVYTRPEVFKWPNNRAGKKYRVPKILLSGNHHKIGEWQKKFAK